MTQAATPGERWWGVIVGVGQYQHLDASLGLEGPPNDLPLVLSWLANQQVPRSHLTVLADRVPHTDGLPTRAAILAALAALPDRMHRGELAFLYFAGHGSQQPQGDRDWTKADGLDETFLPRDVGRWDGTNGRVEGAIVGSEFGHAIDALRARGIFVWVVFDSCHSATGARARAIPGLRARSIAPETLGVPGIARPGPGRSAVERVVHLSNRALPGGYVAFYGAQTAETAPEMPLPAGAPDRRTHGLFTYALLQALGASGSGSYREVAHRILAFYSMSYPDTTPEFEGALDEPIGAEGSPLIPGDWPAVRDGSEFHIAAGRLSTVTAGSLLALSPAFAANARTNPVGLLRVRRATLTEAWADPVSEPRELARWHVTTDRSDELGAGVAHLLESNWDLKVRISGPEPCLGAPPSPLSCGHNAPVGDPALLANARALVGRVQRPAGLELTADSAAADLVFVLRDHRMFLVSPRTVPVSLERMAAVDLDAATAVADLRTALYRATRAVGLQKLAADFPGKPGALHLEAWVRDVSGARQRLDVDRGAFVTRGAQLEVRLQNTGSDDLDVTILSVDEQFAIKPVFPIDRESNRLPRNSAPIEIPGWAGAPGRYELIVICEEARAGQPHDLGYLAQPGVSRRASGSDFDALLARIGFAAPGTRAPITPQERRTAAIEVIRYEVTDRH
jgi:Caspase domain